MFMYKEPFTLQHVFEIEMFCKSKLFFDQFKKVFLVNNSIYFFEKKNPLAPNFWKVVYTMCSSKCDIMNTCCFQHAFWSKI